MRKIPALLLVLGVAALSLTGCVSVGASDCSRPAEPDAQQQSQVDVTGALGSAPTVAISSPMHVEKASAWDVVSGEGTPITADEQLFGLDFSIYDGTTGEKSYASPYDATTTISVAQWSQVFPGTAKLLTCATPGSRIVITIPPKTIADDTAKTLGLDASDSAVIVVDVNATYLSRATGTLVFNDAHNMPTVVRAPNGQPGIIVPETTAPTAITVQTLIRGDGPVLKDSDTALVNYTGVPWESGADVFDTTWGDAPATVAVSSSTHPGFAEALKGQTVGSQVLVVVPADKVEAGQDTSIPTGKTLVYVIDILGVAPVTTQ